MSEMMSNDNNNAKALWQRLVITQESPLKALRSGNLQRAWELADMLESGASTLSYLLLMWELRDTNQAQEAQTTLNRLLELLTQKQVHLSESQMSHIVTFLNYGVVGSDNTFLTLSRLLLDDQHRYTLLQHLALPARLSVTLKIAEQIESDYWKANALSGIATAQAQAGMFEDAIATDHNIERDYRKAADTFVKIATAQIAVDEAAARKSFEDAIALAHSLESDDQKAKALARIATAQVAVDEAAARESFEKAIATAHSIKSHSIERDDWKAEALADIATAQAQGDV